METNEVPYNRNCFWRASRNPRAAIQRCNTTHPVTSAACLQVRKPLMYHPQLKCPTVHGVKNSEDCSIKPTRPTGAHCIARSDSQEMIRGGSRRNTRCASRKRRLTECKYCMMITRPSMALKYWAIRASSETNIFCESWKKSMASTCSPKIALPVPHRLFWTDRGSLLVRVVCQCRFAVGSKFVTVIWNSICANG